MQMNLGRKGCVINDKEKVIGVISVLNKKKRRPSFRDKIADDTITDILRRKGKQKKGKTSSLPSFLFVDKTYFLSEECLPLQTSSELSTRAVNGGLRKKTWERRSDRDAGLGGIYFALTSMFNIISDQIWG